MTNARSIEGVDLTDQYSVVELVIAELEMANSRFDPMNSMHEGWAVVWEELDECWDEVRRSHLPRATEEMVQVAAMALRFILDLNRTDGGDGE